MGGVLKTKQLGKDFQVCWCSRFVEFLRSLPSVDTAILIQPPMARSRQLAFLRWVKCFHLQILPEKSPKGIDQRPSSRKLFQGGWSVKHVWRVRYRQNGLALEKNPCFYKEDRVEKTSWLKKDVQKNTTFKWGPKAWGTFFLAGFDKRWWLRFQSW